ncbi:hypothetical protein [Bradyrhizobium canariense]|uniref:hypothetical protein n=1 Tax=Bradyrhizobium canariense TaxID=255045 RepID=UPI003908BBCB
MDIITRSRSMPIAISKPQRARTLLDRCLKARCPLQSRFGFLGVSLSSRHGEGQAEPQLGPPI